MKQLLNYIRNTNTPHKYYLTTAYDAYPIIQTQSKQGYEIFSILGLENVLVGVGGSIQDYKQIIEAWEDVLKQSLRTLTHATQLNTMSTELTAFRTPDKQTLILPKKYLLVPRYYQHKTKS